MSETQRYRPNREGHVPCELRQYPAADIMDDGCVETIPEVLACIRLANGSIGLVFPCVTYDWPAELTALNEASETPPSVGPL